MTATDIAPGPFTAALDAGEPFVADFTYHHHQGTIIDAGWHLVPFLGGILVGDHLAIPPDRDTPARWTVTDAGDHGGTLSNHYEYDPAGRGYKLVDISATPGEMPGQGTAVDPELARRVIADAERWTAPLLAAAVSGELSDIEADRLAEAVAELPPPTPAPWFAEAPTWLACRRCRGMGTLVVDDVTAQLRQAGHPYTVIGPCPNCSGAAGLVLAPDITTG